MWWSSGNSWVTRSIFCLWFLSRFMEVYLQYTPQIMISQRGVIWKSVYHVCVVVYASQFETLCSEVTRHWQTVNTCVHTCKQILTDCKNNLCKVSSPFLRENKVITPKLTVASPGVEGLEHYYGVIAKTLRGGRSDKATLNWEGRWKILLQYIFLWTTINGKNEKKGMNICMSL